MPGTVLEIESVEGKLIATKMDPIDVFRKWAGRGKIPGNLTVDEYLIKVRE